jgi:hypothetical protein
MQKKVCSDAHESNLNAVTDPDAGNLSVRTSLRHSLRDECCAFWILRSDAVLRQFGQDFGSLAVKQDRPASERTGAECQVTGVLFIAGKWPLLANIPPIQGIKRGYPIHRRC